jgi:hypothetical protein
MMRGRGNTKVRWLVAALAPFVLACTEPEPGPDEGADAETGPDCVSDSDCDEAAPFCVEGSCHDGAAGAACEFASDCGMEAPYCAMSACSAGALGDPCEFDNHCASMICGVDMCTEGLEGDPCEFPEDCTEAAPFCPDAAPMCTDGSEGDPCTFQSECQDGLTCTDETCVA